MIFKGPTALENNGSYTSQCFHHIHINIATAIMEKVLIEFEFE